MNKRTGFALVTALAAIVVAVMLFLGLSTLGRGVRGELKHFSSRTMNFSIAENICAKIIGEVYSSNWESRPFKSGPVTDSGTQMGGKFESYVEDFDADEKLFDIYVKVESDDITLLHFWRIQYNDDLLDVSMYLPYVYELFPVDKFPGDGGAGVKAEVDEILQKRKDNEDLATQIANEISPTKSLDEVLQILNLPPSNGNYVSEQVKNPGISLESYGTLADLPAQSSPYGGAAPIGGEVGQEAPVEDTAVQIMVQSYLKYLHRGPDVAGLNFWINVMPDIQSVEEMKEYHEGSMEYAARQIAIDHFNLDPVSDNPKIVYYQISVPVELKEMDYSSTEFIQAVKDIYNSLPPVPNDFEVQNLYLGFD